MTYTEDKVITELSCFKAYDIRGRVPDDLNEELAYRIGRAYAQFLDPSRVVVGRDVRLTSKSLADALTRGLMDGGCDVFDIGVCGTEMVYFATFYERMDGGIMVTASHNPADYNGMKLVREEAKPISGDTGLNKIKELVLANVFEPAVKSGTRTTLGIGVSYISHLLGYVDVPALRPLRVVVNAGNGCAGNVLDVLEHFLPVSFIKIHHEPDGNFPNGVPNPLLPENRTATRQAVIDNGADIGIAWDGDFDRCFVFDEHGEFIEGYYIVGLLSSAILARNPGARIIHDPRLTWNTIDMVRNAGGISVMSKTGHAFIKERMRLEDAAYGGEMSAHHYFRDFAYCDSGMIPMLLVLEMMSRTGSALSELIEERKSAFPCSGEINCTVPDPEAVIKRVGRHYLKWHTHIDLTDGLSMEFPQWRFNLRSSNTEPVLRLNVEARGDQSLMLQKTEEIIGLIHDGR